MHSFLNLAKNKPTYTANHIAVYCGLYHLYKKTGSREVAIKTDFGESIKVSRRGTLLSVLRDFESDRIIEIVQKGVNRNTPTVVRLLKFQRDAGATLGNSQHDAGATLETKNVSIVANRQAKSTKTKNTENREIKVERKIEEKPLVTDKPKASRIEKIIIPDLVKTNDVEYIEVEEVLEKPKVKQPSSKQKPNKPPTLISKIRAITEEHKPEYYWTGKDGGHAKHIINQINFKCRAIRGRDATDEEILNAYRKIITNLHLTFLKDGWDVSMISSQLNKIWDIIFKKKPSAIVDPETGKELTSVDVVAALIKKERGLL